MSGPLSSARTSPGSAGAVSSPSAEAAGREELRQLRLEEIVRESVHVQHRAVNGLVCPGLAPHKHGGDLTLAVRIRAKLEHMLLVTLEGVGLPVENG
jgi:hypothetical protein